MAPPLTASAWLRFDAIRRGLDAVDPSSVLEVGAGEGAMAWRLARRFEYEGLEPDPASFSMAASRLAALGRGRVRRATTADLLAEERYDLVCSFEVLEHVPDDRGELVRWSRFLRPGGSLLVSVPAHRKRYGPADQVVGHQRRYDREDLRSALREGGFEIVWIESWGVGIGHLLEGIRHLMAKRLGREPEKRGTAGSGRWLQPHGFLAGVLTAAVAAPFRLAQYPLRGTSLGIGWVALAQRRR